METIRLGFHGFIVAEAQKKLHYLIVPAHVGVSTIISKAEGYRF